MDFWYRDIDTSLITTVATGADAGDENSVSHSHKQTPDLETRDAGVLQGIKFSALTTTPKLENARTIADLSGWKWW